MMKIRNKNVLFLRNYHWGGEVAPQAAVWPGAIDPLNGAGGKRPRRASVETVKPMGENTLPLGGSENRVSIWVFFQTGVINTVETRTHCMTRIVNCNVFYCTGRRKLEETQNQTRVPYSGWNAPPYAKQRSTGGVVEIFKTNEDSHLINKFELLLSSVAFDWTSLVLRYIEAINWLIFQLVLCIPSGWWVGDLTIIPLA